MESQPQNPEFMNTPENFHSCVFEIYFSYFSIKTYVAGTQENLYSFKHPKHMLKLINKK